MSTMNSQNFQAESWNILGGFDLNTYNWNSNKVENDDFLTEFQIPSEIFQDKVSRERDMISTPTPSPSPTTAEVPDLYGYRSPPVMNMMETDAPQQVHIKNDNIKSSCQLRHFDSLSPQDGSFFKNETVNSLPKDYCVPSPNDEVPYGSPYSFYYDISSPQNGNVFKSEVFKEDSPKGSPNSLCYDYEAISVQVGNFFDNEIMNSRLNDFNAASPQYAVNNKTQGGSAHSLGYDVLSPQDGSFFKTEIGNQLSSDCSISSPQFSINDEVSRSPNSLYYESLSPQDGSFFKSEVTKPRLKDECLVSLLSAPTKPMTNTINDTIISQLGHANSDHTKGGSNRLKSFNNVTIKTEVIDTQYMDIKEEHISFDMASSSACQLPSDICAIAFQNVCADIQATCRKLQISEDPTKWSVDDVQLWIMKTLEDYNHPPVSSNSFHMNGMQLRELSLGEFCQKAPLSGNMLYAQMEIWKTTCRQKTFSLDQPFVDSNQQIPVDTFTQWTNNTNFPGSPDSTSSSDTNLTDVDMRQNSDGCSPVIPARHDDETSSDDEEGGDKTVSASPPGKKPGSSHSQIHLYEFLWNLLNQPRTYSSCIRWLDRTKGIFKIEDSAKVANLWGIRKNRPAMNYDKMSRSIRQYYRKQIMKKTTKSQRLVYQFCLDKLQDKNGELAKKVKKVSEPSLPVL